MKFVKYLAVLSFVLCAFASNSQAQTVQFVGGGSSALFLELGQAAQSASATSTPCLWTQKSVSTIAAVDNRTSTPTPETGNIWVTWSVGAGASCSAPANPGVNVYSYMSLDSVIGDRCYFETETSGVSGCQMSMTIAAGTAGANLLGTSYPDSAGGIPALIIAAINGLHYNAIGTDIRPEDAKFASLRMFTPCGTAVYRQPFDLGLRQTYGLGYQTATTGVGTTVLSSISTKSFHVLDFNFTGNDPITGKPVPAYNVLSVGAQPIIVAVSPATDTTGIAGATDINGFTLTLFQQGVLGRSTDLLGPSVTNPVTTLIREPLSGTYNTMEFSIPNSSQFHGSQDDNNCNGSGGVYANPMTLQSTNGTILAYRKRVIGTGEMVATLQAATGTNDTLGYFFWSAANASGLTNVKYLTVNGVDPIQNSYSDGVLPGNDVGHPLSNVTFKGLNAGDYPVWSALRIVTKNPVPAGATALVAAAQTLTSTQSDFITLTNLKVWHSHFYMPAVNSVVSSNGNTISGVDVLCGGAAIGENGGDAGGSTLMKQANVDFCSDFGNIDGLINKAN